MGDIPMKYDKKELVEELSSYLIVALISYLFVYGFELTHFTLSIDEESFDNFGQTLSAGRWGHALLRHYLLPEPYVPFYTTAISIVILSASAALSALYLKLDRIHAFAFVIMLAALPQFAYQLQFDNQSDTVAIALLSSVSSLFMLNSHSLKSALLFVLLTVISLSIYQSIFLYAVSLFCVWFTLESVRNKFNLASAIRTVIIYCILVVVSLIINAFLTKQVASFYHVEISGYLSAMIGWGNKSPSQITHALLRFMASFFRFKSYYGLGVFTFSAVWIIGIVIFAYTNKAKPALTALLCFITLLSTFFLNFALGTGLPARAMTQLPMVFAGLFVIFLVASRLKYTGLALAFIFLINGSAASNALFYSDYMARQSDARFAEQLVNVIYSKFPTYELDETPVFFYGSYTPPNAWKISRADVFGASFFDWDGGNNYRIYHYLSMANIINLKRPTPEQVTMAIKAGNDMPTWPDRESIQYHDGVIIVKIGKTLSLYNR